MTTVARTPSASYNALQANSDLYITGGFFDITLPADYTTGMPIAFTVVGGCVADGAAPTSFSYHCEISLYSVNGGSLLTATLDPHGYGLAVGSNIAYLNTIAGSTITTTGVDQTILSSDFTAPLNYETGTLEDGVAVDPAYSGEGFIEELAWTHYHGPIGWWPGIVFANASHSGDPFSANQVVTAEINIDLDVEDAANPDRSIYCVIQSITLQFGSHAPIDIPVTSLKVGWSTGVAYTAVNKSGAVESTASVHTNPLRAIDFSDPVNFPNEQIQEDFYLQGAGPSAVQRTQGHVF